MIRDDELTRVIEQIETVCTLDCAGWSAGLMFKTFKEISELPLAAECGEDWVALMSLVRRAPKPMSQHFRLSSSRVLEGDRELLWSLYAGDIRSLRPEEREYNRYAGIRVRFPMESRRASSSHGVEYYSPHFEIFKVGVMFPSSEFDVVTRVFGHINRRVGSMFSADGNYYFDPHAVLQTN